MMTAWVTVWGILIVLFQASALVPTEKPTCVPGFQSDMLVYQVVRKHLRLGTRLGKVGFSDCTERRAFPFHSDDGHFTVQTDGMLKVKRPIDIHRHREFTIHSWDSEGHRISVPVRVVHHGHRHGKHHHDVERHYGEREHHNHLHRHTKVDSAENTESTTDQQVPILQFAKSVEGLRRRKRDWVIPPISVPENSRGPYPLKVAQIRSDRVGKIYYSITGSGASEAPVGIFAVHRDSGNLYVTQPLDREAKASYMFHAHAVADGAGIAEQPIEIIVNVIDQNDNKPVFAQSTFLGEVAESSPEGSEVIKIEATDLDEPNNDNSDIRYRIQSQDPTLPSDPLFAINPITGVIRVNAGGLDREKYPNYTLVVRAADMRGEGLNGEAKVILTVTHSNDNASAVTQPASTTDQQVPILQFAKSVEGLRRRKRAWIISPLGVAENSRGPYPLKVAQIRSIEHRVKRIYYSITGSGASEAPVGIFAVHRDSGNLYVTQPLDREAKASYMFHAHAVADGAGIAEQPIEIIVNVIDQNDNKPVFAQSTFLGEVAESSPEGSEVIKIEATDLDEPNNDNSDIRYRIQSQDPTLPSDPLFAINPITGVIRVNAGGLDREKYPNYTLVVRAADMRGEGLNGEAKVILTVTHSNDNASAVTQPASTTDQQVPILQFAKSVEGLRRRKRAWIIPPLGVAENSRGPYPLKVAQIRSIEHRVKRIYYSITGPGASEAPFGIFTIDRDSGNMYVTQPLDREEKESYMFEAHAVADGAGIAEEPMEIIVNVIDQNDNKPVFAQSTFLGEVAESSPGGSEVIKIEATDLDEPNNDNSDIRYRILSQDPTLPSDPLFAINPVTGVIRVNTGGLDREKYPNYTLVVRAADLRGEGLSGEAKVILTVTHSNDNAPAFTQPAYEASVEENKIDAHVITMSVTDGDEPLSAAWNAVFTIVAGDPGGLFTVKTTESNKHEGIISTAKALDFERSTQHTLLVAVVNEVPFAIPLLTATTTVVVTVLDVNEAPILNPM